MHSNQTVHADIERCVNQTGKKEKQYDRSGQFLYCCISGSTLCNRLIMLDDH